MPGSIFSAKIDPACFPQASGRPALRGTNLAPWAVDRPNAIRPAESGAASGQKQQQMDSRRGKNMIKGLYRSAAGMIPLPYNQDLVTNNLANNNTAGFKQDRMFIRDLVEADLYLNENGIASTGQAPVTVKTDPPAFRASVGDSSRVIEQATDYRQGRMDITGNDFNLAIDGAGFFAVQTPDGVQYTRNGQFAAGANGNLVTAEGFNVMGAGGQPINVQGGKLSVQRNGAVFVDDEQRGTLNVVDFPQPYLLTKTSDSRFIPQPGGGTAQPAQGFSVLQGALEMSNANPIDMLVRLIEVERMFEFGQRAIRLQDETLQQAVSQVGRV